MYRVGKSATGLTVIKSTRVASLRAICYRISNWNNNVNLPVIYSLWGLTLCSSKKKATNIFMAQLRQTLTDFQNSFAA